MMNSADRGREDRVAVIINQKAKNANSFSQYTDAFSKQKIEFTLYQIEPQELDAIIQEAQAEHAILLVGGGDGTIRSAAQHCVKSQTLLGILPLGTMNHFAKELALPSNPEEMVEALKNRKTVTIDVGEVNGLIFINNSSVGFYPKFARKRDYYTRFYNKWLTYIPTLIEVMRKHETLFLTVKSKKLNLTLDTSFLMVSNNLYSYQFPLTIERESFHQGLLGIYFLKYGKMRLLKVIRSFFREKNYFEVQHSDRPVEVAIRGHQKIRISLDGDTLTTTTPLFYQSLPQVLTILTKS